MNVAMSNLVICFLLLGNLDVYACTRNLSDTVPKNSKTIDIKVDPVYDTVDVYAKIDSLTWYRYCLKHLQRFLEDTTRKIPPGSYTVQIRFVVEIDGSVSDAKALTNSGLGLEEEALKIILSGPKWSPGIRKGKAVRSYRTQLITFITEEQ